VDYRSPGSTHSRNCGWRLPSASRWANSRPHSLQQERTDAAHRPYGGGRVGPATRPPRRSAKFAYIALTDAGEEKYRQALPIHLEHVKRHFAAYIEDGEAAAVESALVRMANAVRRESGL